MIGNITLALSSIIAIIGIVRYKKLTMPFKLLTLSLISSQLITIGNIYINYKYKNNAALSHIDAISNYLFYSLIYYYLFKNKNTKYFILLSIFLITVFFFINALFLQPYARVFPSNLNLPTEVLYVIFSVLLYKQMLLYPLQVNIIKQSIFWYNTAILFFASTMFINLQLVNYYSSHKYNSIVINSWYSINIIFDIMQGIAILADRKEVTKANAQ